MTDHWQLWIVIPIVAAAAGWLLWRVVRFLRGAAGGCGSQCGGCGSAEKKTVVPLASLKMRERR